MSGPAPVVVALVDVSGGEEFLELVRSSLEAALEALPPVTRFALITFSNRVGGCLGQGLASGRKKQGEKFRQALSPGTQFAFI